jgi:outer membrane receptor protein involved in Fe transport
MEMRIATRRNAFVSEIGARYTSSTIDYMEIKFQNNQWLSKNTNWSLPTWIAKAEYSKSLNDRIILRADLMAISKRKGGFQDNGQITILKDALVGNAQANYQLNKRWRLSLQVENFMNSKAEIWDGYPVLPLRVLLGGQCALD